MKKIILGLIGTVLIFQCYSQQATKEKELSNSEKFSSKAGTLIKKEFVDVGAVKKAEIKVVHYTDMISNEKISSVRIETAVVGKYSTDTKIAVLDADEIDGLLTSIKLIQEKILATAATNYTEVTYKSRGGFEAGCYWSKGKWSAYLKLEKYDGKSYVFLKPEDFPELLNLLRQAKEKL